ncbi:MAG: transcriptional regulator BolA [Methylococcales bacterium]|jgi:BolA family transcriptional regulator, general stress-responsive regulator|nr:transcriptional regulator BolA [Methylococcales bacterium]
MTMQQTIETKLKETFSPTYLEVINESSNHSVPEGSESHFKLIVVSDEFEDKRLIQRHRLINGLLSNELKTGIHALALHTMTPNEWSAKSKTVPDSPNCRGGSKT